MTEIAVPTTPPAVPGLAKSLSARPFLPALVVLFVGSGCAALIYEIVWLDMLGLVIGQSAISLGVLLGTFMGGMCLGSLLLPKFLSRKAHPLLVYGILEFSIGAIGLLELWLVPMMGELYTGMAIPGAGRVALRAVMAGICLLPPTILMGATLPAIARYVESSPKGVSWLGFFYGGNTLGAVIGCLLAGFLLLPYHDKYFATYCAAAVNLGVAGLAMILSLLAKYEPDTLDDGKGNAETKMAAPGAWAVYVTLALSGLTGLGAEVVWTRQLSLMLGATVYTFSNILAVFLLGLGIGSSVGSFIARSVKQPKAALSWCQFLLAASIAWAAYAISKSLPFWPIDLINISSDPWSVFQVNLAQCLWAVLPGALLWGASFPIGLAALARKNQDPGKLVGGLYAANTVGAIIGSLLFSMVMMRYFGSQNAQRVLVAICTLSGIIAIAPLFKQVVATGTARLKMSAQELADLPHPAVLMVGLLGAVVASAALIVTIDGPNWGAVAWGRNSATEMPGLYPGILHKEVPLTDDEFEVMRQAAKDYDFKHLEAEGEVVKYTLNNESDRPKVEEWLKTHEKTLASALRKKDMAADEYVAIRDANKRGLKAIKLVDDQLQFKQSPDVSPETKQANDDWVDAHRADLLSALRHRAVATGTGSILPYDDTSSDKNPDRYCVFLGEGMNVSVAVTYDEQGYRYFHGAGKVQASSNPDDMRLQRTLGHISALTNYAQTGKTPKDVLVVACGAGVTAGSFVPYGANITIVDIEPMVPRYVTPQFADVNHDVIPYDWSGRPTGYKKTNIVIDDGRHFIRTSKDKFDVITSDPIDPWVKGCAALNTIEYYQMCKDHLRPGGIMALWIPFYESTEQTSKSIIATFFKVFPNGILWSNDQNGSGYDAVLFGSVDPQGGDGTLKLNIDKIQEYLDQPENQAIRQSLRDVHFGERGIPGTCEAVELLATYAGTAPRMRTWSKEAEDNDWINTDRNLRLQYIAGMHVNQYVQGEIFNNILRNYTWPSEIFTGTSARMHALQEVLRETGRNDPNTPVIIDDAPAAATPAGPPATGATPPATGAATTPGRQSP